MEARFKESTIVIKTCVENPKVIDLRVTALESIYPTDYTQEDHFRSRTTTMEWSMFEEIIMSSINNADAGKMLCANYLQRLNEWHMSKWFRESKSNETNNANGDVAFLKYKLENFHPVDIAQHYYSWQIISMQTSLIMWVECGEYLVCINWTSDLMSLTWDIYDIKYYSWWKFGDKDKQEKDVYTIDNYRDSILHKKCQWYCYPLMLDMRDSNWESVFEYHVYSKWKNAPSKKDPEAHLKREVIKCVVSKDKAIEELKKHIVRYFVAAKQNWQQPGEYIVFK